jgi:hypothetical protein
MPTRFDISPGGEFLRPFAKAKLKQLRSRMEAIGAATLSKMIALGGNDLITIIARKHGIDYVRIRYGGDVYGLTFWPASSEARFGWGDPLADEYSVPINPPLGSVLPDEYFEGEAFRQNLSQGIESGDDMSASWWLHPRTDDDLREVRVNKFMDRDATIDFHFDTVAGADAVYGVRNQQVVPTWGFNKVNGGTPGRQKWIGKKAGRITNVVVLDRSANSAYEKGRLILVGDGSRTIRAAAIVRIQEGEVKVKYIAAVTVNGGNTTEGCKLKYWRIPYAETYDIGDPPDWTLVSEYDLSTAHPAGYKGFRVWSDHIDGEWWEDWEFPNKDIEVGRVVVNAAGTEAIFCYSNVRRQLCLHDEGADIYAPDYLEQLKLRWERASGYGVIDLRTGEFTDYPNTEIPPTRFHIVDGVQEPEYGKAGLGDGTDLVLDYVFDVGYRGNARVFNKLVRVTDSVTAISQTFDLAGFEYTVSTADPSHLYYANPSDRVAFFTRKVDGVHRFFLHYKGRTVDVTKPDSGYSNLNLYFEWLGICQFVMVGVGPLYEIPYTDPVQYTWHDYDAYFLFIPTYLYPMNNRGGPWNKPYHPDINWGIGQIGRCNFYPNYDVFGQLALFSFKWDPTDAVPLYDNEGPYIDPAHPEDPGYWYPESAIYHHVAFGFDPVTLTETDGYTNVRFNDIMVF